MKFGHRPELVALHREIVTDNIKNRGCQVSFAAAAPRFFDTPVKTTVLHDVSKRILGDYLPAQNQPRGTCTSRGLKRILDLLQCAQKAADPSVEFKLASHAVIYGLGRTHMGMLGGDPDNENDDGCTGAGVGWGAVNGGDLANLDDSDDDNSDDLACLWGAKGVPDSILKQASAHKVRSMAAVSGLDDARAAVVNGYGFTVASSVGFEGIRSRNAFARDSDGRAHRGGTWPHQMCCTGWRQDKDWFLIDQSWGPHSPDGPLGSIAIPGYSFWIAASDMSAMLSEQDAWVFSGFDGWKANLLHWVI